MSRVIIGRTTDRTRGYTTPTSSEEKCIYFHDRFIKHGLSIKENRAICSKTDSTTYCDYYKLVNGIPFCQRYWYGPIYEETDLIPIPHLQKRNEMGALLFYEDDGQTITYNKTDKPVVVPIYEAIPLFFTGDESEKEQLMFSPPDSDSFAPAYWEFTNEGTNMVEYDTGYPAYIWGNKEFYSSQYIDTHEKIFSTRGNTLGWQTPN